MLALDPLPRIAGVASSIIGTLQNVVGAAGALVGAVIYDGTVRIPEALRPYLDGQERIG